MTDWKCLLPNILLNYGYY